MCRSFLTLPGHRQHQRHTEHYPLYLSTRHSHSTTPFTLQHSALHNTCVQLTKSELDIYTVDTQMEVYIHAPVWVLLLFGCLLSCTGEGGREQLGYPIDEQGMIYHDGPNFVTQVILMNPSQQIQSDDVLIKKWKMQWDYLDTKIRIQLWRLSPDAYGQAGYYTLKAQTSELTSMTSGNVTFVETLVAHHGDVLGIFLVTENPVPYRRPPGPCDNLLTRTWQLEKQATPFIGFKYKFVPTSVGHMCRHYLIEAEYDLVGYSIGEKFELGSKPSARLKLEQETSGVIIVDPSSTLPFRARTRGWKAYFNRPLTKVRFVVLSPNDTGIYYLSYLSNEYSVVKAGEFYARISFTTHQVVPKGSVIGLNFSKENPIPYTSVSPCPMGARGMYLDLQSASGTGPYMFMHRTADPCRNYSVQLVYENAEARYPRECHTLIASPSKIGQAVSGLYHDQGGIQAISTKECWVVDAGGGGVPVIHIRDLHLSAGNCPQDGRNVIEIRDGSTKDGPLLKAVCPGDAEVTVTGCSQILHIYLKTTDSVNKKGLRFSYTTAPKENASCPFTATVSSGQRDAQLLPSVCLMCVLVLQLTLCTSLFGSGKSHIITPIISLRATS